MNSKPITFPNGTIKWLTKDRTLHREDGPAIIFPNGDKEWYCDNFLHREGGPAVENISNAMYVWVEHGMRMPFDVDKFIYVYRPSIDNIELLLCDRNEEVRKFAKEWYKENK